jgi:hypothetical protein
MKIRAMSADFFWVRGFVLVLCASLRCVFADAVCGGFRAVSHHPRHRD